MNNNEEKEIPLMRKIFIELLGSLGITYIMIWTKIFSDLNRINYNEIAFT